MKPTRTLRRAALLSVLLLASLIAVGCKREANQVPELQGAAPIDARPTVEGFALVSAGRGERQGDVAIALAFSQPLAASQDFDALIVVTGPDGAPVKGSWVLDSQASTLRFPYVEASRDYRVLVRAGLSAADGKTLGKDDQRTVNTGPVEPAVGFASQGSVLPARDTRGLPVVSVNVQEVDVEFLRVRDKELSSFFSQYQRGGRRGSWELDSEYGDKTPMSQLAEPVYVNRFVLGGK
ncbi:MAG: alpha-2-macroglobulin family protein, partial [Arenimonas sp.]|nr:alpha-2-macroglobulin family protein [Arenimonas sp.]